MSQENMEIARSALVALGESYARGEAVNRLLDICAPDIRIDASRRVFNPAVYEGHEGVRRAIRDVANAWEGFSERNRRLIDVGDDRVVVIGVIQGRGRSSGAEVKTDGALICIIRGRRVAGIEIFLGHDEALKAVGLEE